MPKASTPKAVAQAEAAKQANTKLNGDALPSVAITRVVLLSPYAFYDDDDQLVSFSVGQEVTDPDDIEVLIARDAPIQMFGETADDTNAQFPQA